MNVKQLLAEKQAKRDADREEERRRMIHEANIHRDKLTAALEIITDALEGLDVTELGRGQWKINWSGRTVYVECRYHLERFRPCDECREEEEWCIKVGLSTRAINVPEMYSGVDSFAENLSDFLLRLN